MGTPKKKISDNKKGVWERKCTLCGRSQKTKNSKYRKIYVPLSDTYGIIEDPIFK
jgi:hypothetical protein